MAFFDVGSLAAGLAKELPWDDDLKRQQLAMQQRGIDAAKKQAEDLRISKLMDNMTNGINPSAVEKTFQDDYGKDFTEITRGILGEAASNGGQHTQKTEELTQQGRLKLRNWEAEDKRMKEFLKMPAELLSPEERDIQSKYKNGTPWKDVKKYAEDKYGSDMFVEVEDNPESKFALKNVGLSNPKLAQQMENDMKARYSWATEDEHFKGVGGKDNLRIRTYMPRTRDEMMAYLAKKGEAYNPAIHVAGEDVIQEYFNNGQYMSTLIKERGQSIQQQMPAYINSLGTANPNALQIDHEAAAIYNQLKDQGLSNQQIQKEIMSMMDKRSDKYSPEVKQLITKGVLANQLLSEKNFVGSKTTVQRPKEGMTINVNTGEFGDKKKTTQPVSLYEGWQMALSPKFNYGNMTKDEQLAAAAKQFNGDWIFKGGKGDEPQMLQLYGISGPESGTVNIGTGGNTYMAEKGGKTSPTGAIGQVQFQPGSYYLTWKKDGKEVLPYTKGATQYFRVVGQPIREYSTEDKYATRDAANWEKNAKNIKGEMVIEYNLGNAGERKTVNDLYLGSNPANTDYSQNLNPHAGGYNPTPDAKPAAPSNQPKKKVYNAVTKKWEYK